MSFLKRLFGNKPQSESMQESATVWFNQGSELGSQKRYAEALSCFDMSLALDPNQADVWESKAHSLIRLERLEEALPCYDRALALEPQHAHALFGKGAALANLGRFSEAIPFLERSHQQGHALAEQALTKVRQAVKQQAPNPSSQSKVTIMMHCFREPSGAEDYYEKFCTWSHAQSSDLISPITAELGILLKRRIDKVTYNTVQGEIVKIYSELSAIPNDLRDALWSHTIGKGATPAKMMGEVFALSIKELIDDVPFCYVVALEYGNNKLPNNLLRTESQSDSYGTRERLADYLSRRWVIDQKFYGSHDAHSLFKEYPPQWQ